MGTIINRRAVVAAFGAAGVVAASIPVAVAAAPAVDRIEWDQAFATYLRAKAAVEEYEHANAATWQQWRSECDAIQDVVITSDDPSPLFRRTLTTESGTDLAIARRIVARGRPTEGFDRACRALLEAEQGRVEQRNQIAARLGIDALGEMAERLSNAHIDAEFALILMPAPDLAALAWKLEALFGEPGDDEYADSYRVEYIAAVVADAKRLSAGEA